VESGGEAFLVLSWKHQCRHNTEAELMGAGALPLPCLKVGLGEGSSASTSGVHGVQGPLFWSVTLAVLLPVCPASYLFQSYFPVYIS
jgi:hypothetical protein